MCPQIRRRRVAVSACGCLHTLEKRSHAGRIETRTLQYAETDPIRFFFRVPRKIDLFLDRVTLPAHHDGAGSIASGLCGENRQHRCRDRNQDILSLLAQHPGDMPLRNVADFM